MKKIYGFNNGGNPGWMQAVAISEDGVILATHICSHECFMRHDLGMDGKSDWKHEVYNKAFPEGWECEYIPDNMVDSHAGLQDALKKNLELDVEERKHKEASLAGVTVKFSNGEEVKYE